MTWPENHLVGRSVSVTTYQRYGCRCDGCRELASAYIRDYRMKKPEVKAKARAYNRAKHRALQRLMENHRDEFNQILTKERQVS